MKHAFKTVGTRGAFMLLLCLSAISAEAASISGIVHHPHPHEGLIRVIAATNSASWSTNQNHSATLASPGPYCIPSGLSVGTAYWVRAWVDSNANGIRDPWEPAADYAYNPVVVGDAETSCGMLIPPRMDGKRRCEWVNLWGNETDVAGLGLLDSGEIAAVGVTDPYEGRALPKGDFATYFQSDGVRLDTAYYAQDWYRVVPDSHVMPNGDFVFSALKGIASTRRCDITRISRNGEIRWSFNLSNNNIPPKAIWVDSTQSFIYSLRYYNSKPYLVKNSLSNGALAWTMSWGNSDNGSLPAEDIVGDDMGNLYTVGRANHASCFDGLSHAGFYDAYVVKLSDSGTFQWVRYVASTPHNDYGAKIAYGGHNRLFLAGTTGGAWDGHVNAGQADVFLMRLDPDGNVLWTRFVGTEGADSVSDLVVTQDGRVFMACTVGGIHRLHCFDDAGNSRWFMALSDHGFTSVSRVMVAPDHRDVYVAGRQNSKAILARFAPGLLNVELTYNGFQRGEHVVTASTTPDFQPGTTYSFTATNSTVSLHLDVERSYWLRAYVDADNNYSNDSWEASGTFGPVPLADTASVSMALSEADTDGDGMPDWWETLHGFDPQDPNDSMLDADGDGLSNVLEYRLRTNPRLQFTIGSALSDYEKYAVRGLDPAVEDTDGDGMPDEWEILHGLDPLRDDSAEDADGDGVSNLEEYLNALDPRSPMTPGTGVSDYRHLYGKGGARYHYDKDNRLVGAAYDNGLSVGYAYDGGGRRIRRVHLEYDSDGDGLPDLWEFLNGLDWTDAAGGNGAAGDPDGDGWTNMQEWRAGSDPMDTQSTPLRPDTVVATAHRLGSVADAGGYLLCAGRFGSLSDSLVVAAKGVPGQNNVATVFSQNHTGWVASDLQLGPFALDSLLVVPLEDGGPASVVAGLRGDDEAVYGAFDADGAFTPLYTLRNPSRSHPLLYGSRRAGELLVSAGAPVGQDGQLFALTGTNRPWGLQLLDAQASHPHTALAIAQPAAQGSQRVLRLLADGGLQVAQGSPFISYDEFDGTSIDYGKWEALRHSTTLLSVQNNRFRASCSWGVSGDLTEGYIFADLLSSRPVIGIEILITSASRYSSHSGRGTAFVKVGDVFIYSCPSSDSNVRVHILRMGGVCYYKTTTSAGIWSAWNSTALGTLRIGVSGETGGGGNAHIEVEYVRYYTPAALSQGDMVTGGDFNGTDAFYNASQSRWYHRPAQEASWTDMLALSRSYHGSLATAGDSALDSWLRSKFSGDWWLGLYRNPAMSEWHWLNRPTGVYSNWVAGLPMETEAHCFASMSATGWVARSLSETLRGVVEFTDTTFGWEAQVRSNHLHQAAGSMLRPQITVGRLRGDPERQQAVLSYVADHNGNGVVDEGDAFVLAEYTVSATDLEYVATYAWSIGKDKPATTYAISAARLDYIGNERLYVGAPDGIVYAFEFPDGSAPPERHVFDDRHEGKVWHALTSYQGLDPNVQGLAGVVSRRDATDAELVTWPAGTRNRTPAAVPQTAPVTRILPEPDRGAGISVVNIRVWDAEGNRVLPFLQYRDPGTLEWKDATILSLNGQPYSEAISVAAAPGGTDHAFLWYSGHDLGTVSTNNILLRARSVDITLWGGWSESFTYRVNGTPDSNNDGMPDAWALVHGLDPLGSAGDDGPGGDPDGDGVTNLDEYRADTNPRDGQSYLAITGIRLDPEGIRIEWQGGIQAWQRIQVRESLTDPGKPWETIHTLSPPTPTVNHVIDTGATNATLFYRIRATR
jgi:hypothetical protein